MADIVVKSRKLTRQQLATFLKNPHLIKAFEDLQEDVIVTIPDSISSGSVYTSGATELATLAAQSAAIALSAANRATQLAGELQALIASARSPGNLAEIERRLSELEARAYTTR